MTGQTGIEGAATWGSRWFSPSNNLLASVARYQWATNVGPPAPVTDIQGTGGAPAYTETLPGQRVFPLPSGAFRFTQGFGCVPFNAGYTTVSTCSADSPSFHTGVDYGAIEGTPIFAVASGKVVFAGNDSTSSQNTSILIDHDGAAAGYRSEYLHWRQAFVQTGDYVRAGQIIAEVGSIGYSTGPHLHFAVTFLTTGAAIDPVEWLYGSSTTATTPISSNRAPNSSVLHWEGLIQDAAKLYNVPAALIAAIMTVESGGNPEAISPVGAQGLMQVMPYHLTRYGLSAEQWRDPAANIQAGARHLSETLGNQGTIEQATARYFGEGCDALGTCTGQYVQMVMGWYVYYAAHFEGKPLPAAPSPIPSVASSPASPASPVSGVTNSQITPIPTPRPSSSTVRVPQPTTPVGGIALPSPEATNEPVETEAEADDLNETTASTSDAPLPTPVASSASDATPTSSASDATSEKNERESEPEATATPGATPTATPGATPTATVGATPSATPGAVAATEKNTNADNSVTEKQTADPTPTATPTGTSTEAVASPTPTSTPGAATATPAPMPDTATVGTATVASTPAESTPAATPSATATQPAAAASTPATSQPTADGLTPTPGASPTPSAIEVTTITPGGSTDTAPVCRVFGPVVEGIPTVGQSGTEGQAGAMQNQEPTAKVAEPQVTPQPMPQATPSQSSDSQSATPEDGVDTQDPNPDPGQPCPPVNPDEKGSSSNGVPDGLNEGVLEDAFEKIVGLVS